MKRAIPAHGQQMIEEIFTYQALDADIDSLRLIQILPDLRNGHLTCELKHATIHGHYRALSYTWGPDNDQQDILIDGKRFGVRCNLWNFIKIARQEFQATWFWIDAICINQEDALERSEQVRKMGEIYRQSYHTIVWLGPCMGSKCEGHNKHGGIEDTTNVRDYDTRASGLDLQTLGRFPYFFKDAVEEQQNREELLFVLILLSKLFQHPYWNRLWVIQELYLSERKRVITPSISIDWDYIFRLFELSRKASFKCAVRAAFQDSEDTFRSELDYFEDECHDGPAANLIDQLVSIASGHLDNYFDDLQTIKNSLTARQKKLMQFFDLLRAFNRPICSDSRDQIYGLLALSPFPQEFPIDYTQSVYDLYFTCHKFFDGLADATFHDSRGYAPYGQESMSNIVQISSLLR